MSSPINNTSSPRSDSVGSKRKLSEDSDSDFQLQKSKPKRAKAAAKGRKAPKPKAQKPEATAAKEPKTPKAPISSPAPTTIPAASRPRRERKAPERLADTIAAPAIKKQTKRRPGKLNGEFLVTDHRSKLVRANLATLLALPGAWDSLSPDDQLELLGQIPATMANQNLIKTLSTTGERVERPKELQTASTVLKTDIAKFKADLRDGYLGKKWQKDAGVAMEERALGIFDEWKEKNSEKYWGQKMSPDGH